MKALLVSVGALAAVSCSGAGPRCDLTSTHEIAFTASDAKDAVTVRSFGPSCDKAIGVYDIRTQAGDPVWAWTAPLPHAFGDVFPAREPEAMADFLERWAQPSLTTAQAAPEWSALEEGQTTLDRLTYEDIRARDLPVLCHASAAGHEACIFWEPAAGAAAHLFDREGPNHEQAADPGE